jgi:hypothetical protein
VPAERHWLWHGGVSGQVESLESLNVQKIGFLHSPGGDDFVCHLRVFLVCPARQGAGDFHGNLGAVHSLLWNLLQVGRIAGEKAVMPDNLLFLGIYVVVMLLIGLAFTVKEFRDM